MITLPYTTIFLIIILILCVFQLLVFLFIRRNRFKRKNQKKTPYFELIRERCNPLFGPQEHNEWENEAAFNPAAVKDMDGNIHIFYRAIGRGGTSQIGHSVSKDGIIFNERSSYPVFQAPSNNSLINETEKIYDQIRYHSGGGWSGCEDPKAVIIDDRLYMTYVSFEGWHSIRVALTSISLQDLNKNLWNWQKPILISVPNQPNKNWTLFPEKIKGKFVVLHSISPNILIEYIDDLSILSRHPISSRPPHDENRKYFGRENHWDSSVRGVGAPPIKTKYGWLTLYHSMDKKDPNKYKLGAMILDINDPTKILYRSPNPILSPDFNYENDSKPGVIYASGAVIHDDKLIVYYGGGDKYVCIAQAPINQFLEWLKTNGKV